MCAAAVAADDDVMTDGRLLLRLLPVGGLELIEKEWGSREGGGSVRAFFADAWWSKKAQPSQNDEERSPEGLGRRGRAKKKLALQRLPRCRRSRRRAEESCTVKDMAGCMEGASIDWMGRSRLLGPIGSPSTDI